MSFIFFLSKVKYSHICLHSIQFTIIATIHLAKVLLMSFFDKQTKSQQTIIIRKNIIGHTPSEQLYRRFLTQKDRSGSFADHQEPELVMYELLRSLVRTQLRFPFQQLKQIARSSRTVTVSSSQSEFQGHLRHDLQIIAQNLRNVCGLARQRMAMEGFLSLKQAYMRKNRVESAYFSAQNLARLNMATVFLQNSKRSYLKWQAFSRLFENAKGMKLSKITISKIEVVSNDLTAKQFEDINPFLREKEIQAINSYIIDRSSDQCDRHEDSQQLRDEVREIRTGGLSEQQQSIQRHFFARDASKTKERQVFTRDKHASLTEKYFTAKEKNAGDYGEVRVSEFMAEQTEKRPIKKTVTAFYGGRQLKQSEEIDQKVLVTYRKEAQRRQSTSNNRLREQNQPQHHLFLVKDYRSRAAPPSNYVKVPLTEDVKIVQIQHSRKEGGHRKKQRVQRRQEQLLQQICANCKFCTQTRERRAIMQAVQLRFQAVHDSSQKSAQICSK